MLPAILPVGVTARRSREEPTSGALGDRVKVTLALDKRAWMTSLLAQQVMLVSSVATDGTPDVAPKSWVTMVAFEGPVLGFGCNVRHRTYQNIRDTGDFVVNVPPAPLASVVWAMADRHGAERLATSGLTLAPAQGSSAPWVEECAGHLECRRVDIKAFGDEVFIFGRVEHVAIDQLCLEGTAADRYARLNPFFYLEEKTFATLDVARMVGALPPFEHRLVMAELGPFAATEEQSAAHLVYLAALQARGILTMAGPFDQEHRGLVVLKAVTLDEAGELVAADPLVAAGCPWRLGAWRRTF